MKNQNFEEFLSSLGSEVESVGEFSLDPVAALQKMARSQLPQSGLWAVKIVQGAVALDAHEVEVVQGATALQLTLKGGRLVRALDLLEGLLSSKFSSDRGTAHLLAGLRGAYGRPLVSLSWLSRQGGQEERVQLRDGKVFSEEVSGSGTACEFIVVARFRQDSWFSSRASADEYLALTQHCRLCPIPVTVDKRLVSQQPLESHGEQKWMVSWAVDVENDEPSFPLGSKVGRYDVMVYRRLRQFPGRCVLLLSACGEDKRTSMHPKVFWLRDGVLVGPTLLDGWSGPLNLEIVIPADHLQTDLTEWFIRQPELAFPAQLVLENLRQIHRDLDERNPATVSSFASKALFVLKETTIWLTLNAVYLFGSLFIHPDPAGRAEARRRLSHLLEGFQSLSQVSELRYPTVSRASGEPEPRSRTSTDH